MTKNQMAKNTEEDIKIKVILPLLLSLGFESNEISFEKSFPIRLGKFTARVDTQKQITTASPRLDVLVKHNGTNIFVIEVKNDSIDLGDDDKEQAINYARIVHPMAPFAIVTNGKDTKIYETKTTNEVSKTFKFKGYEIGTDLEDLYEQAFQFFIGYSSENVKLFCKSQFIEAAKTIIGSASERHKKFIPELYASRTALDDAFNIFMQSDKVVFAVVGESGAGKTCEMCGMAMKYQSQYPVIFYRGFNLVDGLTKNIATDFNWEFSSIYDEVAVIKRITRVIKKTLIIFIDGVDEWTSATKVQDLGNFASKVKNHKIKIVVSCKKYPWDQFVSHAGIPTQLSEEISTYALEALTPKEFHQLISNYRKFYNFNGCFEDKVLEDCRRSPFLLRVFFEVAEADGLEHLTLAAKSFYERYFKNIVQYLGDAEQEQGIFQLKSIARLLADNSTDSIEVDAVRRELGMRVSERLLPILFDSNILEYTSEGIKTKVSFYFQRLRDYLIAFHIKQWNSSTEFNFKDDIIMNLSNPVLYESLKLFYSMAEEDKQKIFDYSLRTNAEQYLKLYSAILDNHFAASRHKFSPETKGKIGFIAEYDIKGFMLSMYGFRCIDHENERIKFVPVDGKIDINSNVTYLLGASGMHWTSSSNGFQKLSIDKEVIDNEIISQIKKLVERCDLYEGNCYYLSLERVLGALDKLNFFPERYRLGVRRFLPISFDTIDFTIRYKHAYRYFEHELIEEKKRVGIIQETWNGNIVSYNISFTAEDRAHIHNSATQAASNQDCKLKYGADIDFRNLEQMLFESLEVVKRFDTSINNLIIPDADCHSQYVHGGYNESTLKALINRLFLEFLNEYKNIIEDNFSTFKKSFKLYSMMPVCLIIGLEYKPDDSNIKIAYCNNTYSTDNTVVMCDYDVVTFDRKSGYAIKIEDATYTANSFRMTSVGSILSGGYRGNSQFQYPFSVLRGLVYKQISDELKEALNDLRSFFIQE